MFSEHFRAYMRKWLRTAFWVFVVIMAIFAVYWGTGFDLLKGFLGE